MLIFLANKLALKTLLLIPKSNRFIHLTPYVLRLAGFKKVSLSSRIYSSISIRGVVNIIIQDNAYLGHNVEIVGAHASTVLIEQNCDISDSVAIITGTHKIASSLRRAGEGIHGNVTIRSGTWIGYRATILPGITIGKGCVVGANSVVTKDIPDNVAVAGNPARVIKSLF